jgi:MFS family permease
VTTLQNRPTTRVAVGPAHARRRPQGYHVEILLVSFAVLLIEVCYTRVISFKLYYYYTYLVIGLALLGLGSGGVLVAVSRRLRAARTNTVLLWSFLLGGIGVVASYVVVAYTSLDSLEIWDYGTRGSAASMGRLLAICLFIFVPFVAPGVIIATLFGRRPEGVGSLYFADLAGAALACGLVIYLTGSIGPPAAIMLAAGVMFFAGGIVLGRSRPIALPLMLALVVGTVVLTVDPNLLPPQRLDTTKVSFKVEKPIYSAWSSIFRVDAVQAGTDVRALYHDGIIGSAIYKWNGRVSSLAHYDFAADPRAFPFDITTTPPRHEAIIGAAGGHEVLASLWFGAKHIDAVELNPVTYALVTNTFAHFDGHLAQHSGVNYVNADGRSFMARSDTSYNLIWYPAPDSYSATNAATASAFVLSESYLYTTNAVVGSLQHLAPGGIFVAQFGEIDYKTSPYRTTRFVATARQALADMGISDPKDHILVASSPARFFGSFTLSTIIVSRDAFTGAEVNRFASSLPAVPGTTLQYAPGHSVAPNPVDTVVSSTPAQLRSFYNSYRFNVVPTTDNDPYFWHFARFGTVLHEYFHPITTTDREFEVGERVLVLLLALAVLISAVFLLLPFVVIRSTWRRLPGKWTSALFFSAIGFGFMFFEVTLMQLLNLFLGYPTYALTVTLMSLLVFTGLGALLSPRFGNRRHTVATLVCAIIGLTVFYVLGLTALTDGLLGLPMAARVPIAFVLLAPLGLCLGMFMPLGIRAVSSMTDARREYVAWGWAVNGFASVVGAVLATLLSMIFGFHVVLWLGLGAYLLALVVWRRLARRAAASLSAA